MHSRILQVPACRRQFLLESRRHGSGLPNGEQRSNFAKRLLCLWPDNRRNKSQHPEPRSKPDNSAKHWIGGHRPGTRARGYGAGNASFVENLHQQRNHADSDDRRAVGKLQAGQQSRSYEQLQRLHRQKSFRFSRHRVTQTLS